jgi:hypothetical protein
LYIKVDSTYFFEEQKTICENKVLEWRNKTYSDLLVGDTIIWDSLQTVNKPYCDSVYKLNVTVVSKYEFIHVDTVCDNALPYQWRGNDFNTTGVYYDSLLSTSGCDSVYILDLLVTPTYIQYDTILKTFETYL